jgi:Concanavalin A-like lectin/glucanases superfamily
LTFGEQYTWSEETRQVITIGGDGLHHGQYWAGRIDEVRVYNRALSLTEIRTDMNRSIPP